MRSRAIGDQSSAPLFSAQLSASAAAVAKWSPIEGLARAGDASHRPAIQDALKRERDDRVIEAGVLRRGDADQNAPIEQLVDSLNRPSRTTPPGGTSSSSRRAAWPRVRAIRAGSRAAHAHRHRRHRSACRRRGPRGGRRPLCRHGSQTCVAAAARRSARLHGDPVKLAAASFYDRPTLDVARDLIGKVLVHNAPRRPYERHHRRSRGLHRRIRSRLPRRARPDQRNAPLYGPPGFAYVYLNYGIHWLVNAVTEAEGSPAAVLIRALEPLDGIAAMRRRRGPPTCRFTHICRGPGNLTMAMGITSAQNREDLCGGRLYIEDRGLPPADEIAWGPRIGIRVGTERAWRAYVRAHPSVTGSRERAPARLP